MVVMWSYADKSSPTGKRVDATVDRTGVLLELAEDNSDGEEMICSCSVPLAEAKALHAILGQALTTLDS